MGFAEWGQVAIILSIIGIVYASIIAFTQKDAKRLIAYSSIAHVGLIAAGIFAWNIQGLQGAMIQMVNHGINVFGLFFIIDIIIRRLNSREIADMGGIAKVAPQFAIAFLIILLGTVGLTIILGAVYMLRTYQRIMLGATNDATALFADIRGSEKLVLLIVCILVIFIGVYPQPLLDISNASSKSLINFVNSRIQGINPYIH
jgi:NADH-quinone oxidoreductase subunit M